MNRPFFHAPVFYNGVLVCLFVLVRLLIYCRRPLKEVKLPDIELFVAGVA